MNHAQDAVGTLSARRVFCRQHGLDTIPLDRSLALGDSRHTFNENLTLETRQGDFARLEFTAVAFVPTISRLHSALAFGLMLWCAGTGCLAHGMAMGSAPGSKPAKTNFNQSEMAMSGHACCKARHRSLQNGPAAKSNSDADAQTIVLPEEFPSDGANSCCPLTSGSFVTASRSQTNDNNSSAATRIDLPEQSFAVQFPVNRATPRRLPNHEQTYLTCCAFLI